MGYRFEADLADSVQVSVLSRLILRIGRLRSPQSADFFRLPVTTNRFAENLVGMPSRDSLFRRLHHNANPFAFDLLLGTTVSVDAGLAESKWDSIAATDRHTHPHVEAGETT